tara:strand:- start:681 stop:1265 length:585 start_codon:yes stop_codon:yes gene_type:complete
MRLTFASIFFVVLGVLVLLPKRVVLDESNCQPPNGKFLLLTNSSDFKCYRAQVQVEGTLVFPIWQVCSNRSAKVGNVLSNCDTECYTTDQTNHFSSSSNELQHNVGGRQIATLECGLFTQNCNFNRNDPLSPGFGFGVYRQEGYANYCAIFAKGSGGTVFIIQKNVTGRLMGKGFVTGSLNENPPSFVRTVPVG